MQLKRHFASTAQLQPLAAVAAGLQSAPLSATNHSEHAIEHVSGPERWIFDLHRPSKCRQDRGCWPC